MNKTISLVSVVLAMVGCAGSAEQDGPGVQSVATEPTTEPTPPGAVAGTRDADVPMASLGLAFEVLGRPDASVTACQAMQMPLNDSAVFSGHTPGDMDIAAKNAGGCAHDDDGMIDLPVAANTRTAVKLSGPDYLNYLVQVSLTDVPRVMSPVRLLSYGALATVYSALGAMPDAAHTTIVVETSASDASVELLVRSEPGPAPLYLDAEGNPTERDSSVAGGWAVFPSAPVGAHEVFMSHAELTCTPDATGSWRGSNDASIAMLATADTISHTNAFGCR